MWTDTDLCDQMIQRDLDGWQWNILWRLEFWYFEDIEFSKLCQSNSLAILAHWPSTYFTFIFLFWRLGVSHLVTTTCKDVCGKYSGDEGGFSGVANQIADAGNVPTTLTVKALQTFEIIFCMRSAFILYLIWFYFLHYIAWPHLK